MFLASQRYVLPHLKNSKPFVGHLSEETAQNAVRFKCLGPVYEHLSGNIASPRPSSCNFTESGCSTRSGRNSVVVKAVSLRVVQGLYRATPVELGFWV